MVNIRTGNKQVVVVLLNHIAAFDTVCRAQIYRKLLSTKNRDTLTCFIWTCPTWFKFCSAFQTRAKWNHRPLNSETQRLQNVILLTSSPHLKLSALWECGGALSFQTSELAQKTGDSLPGWMKVIYCLLGQTQHAICHTVVCVLSRSFQLWSESKYTQ